MFTDLSEQWLDIWNDEITSLERRSGVSIDDWVVGGRKSKALPDGENPEWWQGEGLRQAEEYLRWLDSHHWEIATLPDGRPGIEWDAIVSFGGRPVKAIIDAVFTNGSDLIIVDYKTGRKKQQPPQLGLYASIIERTTDVRPRWGGFYMSRSAEIDDLHDLSPYSIEFFEYSFGAMNASVDLGMFVPNVSDHCSWCGVRDYCVAQGGPKSSGYPLHTKGK